MVDFYERFDKLSMIWIWRFWISLFSPYDYQCTIIQCGELGQYHLCRKEHLNMNSIFLMYSWRSSSLPFSLTFTPWIRKQLLLLLIIITLTNWSIVFSWIDMIDSSFFSKDHFSVYWVDLLMIYWLPTVRSVFRNNTLLIVAIVCFASYCYFIVTLIVTYC